MDVLGAPHHPILLAGRDRELAILHERFSEARNGRGNLVFVSGEAGIGKTALTDSLASSARRTGARVVAGHCYDRIETPPYGPWIQVAQRSESFTAQAVPRLVTATSQADILEQARDLLVALSIDQPLVLVLEDLHWADRASFDLLRYIAHRLSELPLLLIATYRSEDVDRHHPLTELIPQLVREASTTRLGLRPLDAAAAQTLVRARFDVAEALVQRLATYLIERTEGNALFMTELLRSFDDERALDRLESDSDFQSIAPTPVPLLLKQIIDNRLSRLGDEAAALLAIAAVIGQEVPLPIWQAVTRADEELLLAVAEQAETAHLVIPWERGDGLRFTHALIRDVLYENVSALRRRNLHRRVAEALLAQSSPNPDSVAFHFQRAGDERAATWLVRAAERAEDTFALVVAAARYEAALELLDASQGDASERGWLRILLASLRRHEERDRAFAWTEEAVQLANESADSSLLARATSLLGMLTGYRGDYSGAVSTLAAGLDMIDRLPRGTGTTGRREQQVGRFVNRGTLITSLAAGGRLTEARRHGEGLIEQLAASATLPSERAAIADANMGTAQAYALQGEPDLARQTFAAASLAYQASDNHVLALVSLREGLNQVVLSYQADDLAERERAATAAERIAAGLIERGIHDNPNVLRDVRLPLLVLEGRWREAHEILDLHDPSELPYLARLRPFYRATLARAQGNLETAWQYVHEPCRVSPASEPGLEVGPYPVNYQRLAVGLALDAGNLVTARWWLDLHWRWLDFMEATLGRSDAESLEATWHRAAGDHENASIHAEEAVRWANVPRQPLALISAHRISGLIAADAADAQSAESHFAGAFALSDACHAPFERALTLIAYAEFLGKSGATSRKRDVLAEAQTLCLPLEAKPALAQIERMASQIDRLPGGFPAGLSMREVEVVRLVAAGLSNAEIAERLFLSPNTVKAHVARVLSKIEVRNRAGATEFAIRNGLV